MTDEATRRLTAGPGGAGPVRRHVVGLLHASGSRLELIGPDGRVWDVTCVAATDGWIGRRVRLTVSDGDENRLTVERIGSA